MVSVKEKNLAGKCDISPKEGVNKNRPQEDTDVGIVGKDFKAATTNMFKQWKFLL